MIETINANKVFPINDVTKSIIESLTEFKNKIISQNPNLAVFDINIKNFYTKPASGQTYKECYNNWKNGKNSCELDSYFNNLKPYTYKTIVRAFNNLNAEVKKTGDNKAPYSAYKVFIIIIMCIDTSRCIFRYF